MIRSNNHDSKASTVERRNGIRADRVVAVRHRLVKSGGKSRAPVTWSLSETKNMSVSGLLFLSPMAYKVGDVLELEVVMSGMIDIYNGQAQVVRVAGSGHSYEVAVKYIEKKVPARPAKSHLKK